MRVKIVKYFCIVKRTGDYLDLEVLAWPMSKFNLQPQLSALSIVTVSTGALRPRSTFRVQQDADVSKFLDSGSPS